MNALAGIEKLKALEEIRLLKSRRDRAADTKDWALYESLHAPDHQSHNGDYPAWTSAREMIANVSQIMGPALTTMHHSHTPEIEFDTATTARGIWAMTGLSVWKQDGEDQWFRAFGHYHETYEKQADRWLFTSRRLEYYHTRRSPGAEFPPRLEP